MFTFDMPILEFVHIKSEGNKKISMMRVFSLHITEKAKDLFYGLRFTHYNFGKW